MKRGGLFSCARRTSRRTHERRHHLTIEPLERRLVLDSATLFISEFLAANTSGLRDSDGELSDWIEIHNPSDKAASLEGWYLTDSAASLTKWQFPAVSLEAGGYLLVFASGKNRRDPAGPLHTNFQLNDAGEYLALVRPDGTTVAHDYAPEFPRQYPDRSYGLSLTSSTTPLLDEGADSTYHVPTPGDAPLGTAWTAAAFDDTRWTNMHRGARVLITEAGTSTIDYVEIQNVASQAIDTSGWVVAVNSRSAAGINGVVSKYWALPNSMPAGQILYKTNNASDNYWGADWSWLTTSPAWVMILDAQGRVADFVVWGYTAVDLATFSVDINGTHITAADLPWNGDPVPAGATPSKTLQRSGNVDGDTGADWSFVSPHTKGTKNAAIVVPFANSGQQPVQTGLGFDSVPPTLGSAIHTDVGMAMRNANASIWTRTVFYAGNPAAISSLLLQMKYNDGFVAYLNGQPIAQRNAPQALTWDSTATAQRTAADSLAFETIEITSFRDLLQPGRNVLAIQGLNVSASDGNFLLLPRLVATSSQLSEHYLDVPTPGVRNRSSMVVINEIHSNPDVKTEPVEFIELYNAGDRAADLSGWTFTAGVSYTFPPGTSLAPDAYLVVGQNPAAVRSKFGVSTVLGPFVGQLANEGETLTLRDALGVKQDEVDYGLGFPWPTVGDAPGCSLELVNPMLDNSLGGSWRSSLGTGVSRGPTPGARNSVFSLNSPPQLRQVAHSPTQPSAGQAVTITVKATDPEGVAGVSLAYQLVEPGDYIEITDSRYNSPTSWVTLAMHDDGLLGDAQAGDNLYTVVLPGSLQAHRRLVRYRITATDARGLSVTAPYSDDPQPNFAYYVYNGVPSWTGSAQPGVKPNVTYGSELLNTLPVYQLITTRKDHVDAQHIPNSTASAYGGDDYLWHGTLVYDGQVYDHIRFRARGGVWRYAMGKNMWKFDFNRGHEFQARDDYGRLYDTKWDKLNFSAIIQQGDYLHRGEQGLFESVGFKLFNLAGVESSETNFVHFRIVENADEIGATQYSGDFQGMYLALEQMDGRMLDEHGLPDGNLYKMDSGAIDVGPGGGALNNQGPTQPSDNSDLVSFVNSYNTNPSDQWWRDNLDLERYYSYRAIVEAIHHGDIGYGKNYFYYHNPETGKWQVHPWDLDLTWAENMFGNGNEPFKSPVLNRPALNLEYRNRLREILDLLFNVEQTGMMIDEFTRLIYTPGQPSWVDADRAMWDYNPIMVSGYVNSSKSGTGRYYGAAVNPPGGFAGMVQKMKNYITFARTQTRNWMGETGQSMEKLATDTAIPNTPTVTYLGMAGYPVDDLRFQSSAFSDTTGTFAAMEWRIAGVSDRTSPTFDPTKPWKYEIQSDWESGELPVFNNTVTIPGDNLQAGETYRVRVRMKDSTGRWSHWSSPVQFVLGQAMGPVPMGLVVTELNYNPHAATSAELAVDPAFGNDDFEFIEFRNVGQTPVSLASVKLTTGITFDFSGAKIAQLDPGEYVVAARNLTAFHARYGDAPMDRVIGPYSGKLDNDGERLVLVDRFGRTILDFTYDDANAWPGRADGNGSSLELIDAAAVPATQPQRTAYLQDATHWRSSSELGGTPGSAGVGSIDSVVINEILSHSDLPLRDTIELFNPTGGPVDLGGWYLSDSFTNGQRRFRIPDGTTIAPGAYLVYDEDDFNPTPNVSGTGFALDAAHGDDVWLLWPDGKGTITVVDHVGFGATKANESLGRWPNGSGPLYPMVQSTFDSAHGQNSGPRVGPLVISELCYWPQAASPDDFEFVEVYNPTAQTVELTNWRLAEGVTFDFPVGRTLAPRAAIVVVPFDPAINTAKLTAFRSHYGVDATTAIIGPYSGRLSDNGETVQLQRPDAPPPSEPTFVPRVLEDEIDYLSTWQATANGGGHSLARLGSRLWGDASASWIASAPTPGSASLAQVSARHVFYNQSAFDGHEAAANAADDQAIAPDKQALLPGQTATFQNYTSYSRGLNGIMIDLWDLKDPGALSAADFAFRVGSHGDLGSWTAPVAPSQITVRSGAGVDGADRVTLVWPEGAIQNAWLEVTVLATSHTGLSRPDVFYFGNVIGETGNVPGDTRVDATDVLLVRNHQRSFLSPAAIDFAYDFDRDQRVNAVDLLIARNHQTNFATAVELISVAAVKAQQAAQEPDQITARSSYMPSEIAAARDRVLQQDAAAVSIGQASAWLDDGSLSPRKRRSSGVAEVIRLRTAAAP